MIGAYDGSSEIFVKNNKELREFADNLTEKFSKYINVLDILLIYDEYDIAMYPL